MHPEESWICSSAIVDRAMPVFGGLIGVGISKGLEHYPHSDTEIFGVTVEDFSKSHKSFFTFKVDNVDMV